MLQRPHAPSDLPLTQGARSGDVFSPIWRDGAALVLGDFPISPHAIVATARTVSLLAEDQSSSFEAGQPRIRRLRGNAGIVPLPDGSIDALLCTVSEFEDAALPEWRRVLTARGCIAIFASEAQRTAASKSQALLASQFTHTTIVSVASDDAGALLCLASQAPLDRLCAELLSVSKKSPAATVSHDAASTATNSTDLLNYWRNATEELRQQLTAERAQLSRLHDALLDQRNGAADEVHSLRRSVFQEAAKAETAAAQFIASKKRLEAVEDRLATAHAQLSDLAQRYDVAVAHHASQTQSLTQEIATLRQALQTLRDEARHLQESATRATSNADTQKRRAESAERDRDEALNRPTAVMGGAVVLEAARAIGQSRIAARNQVWRSVSTKPPLQRRFARTTRAHPLSAILRRHWTGRLAILMTSGLYAPADGPGRRSILRAAQGDPNARVHPLFDPEWYLDRNPDLRGGGTHPALHYLMFGDREGRSPHPLFDVRWYREQYRTALADWPLTTLEHFLLVGARAGHQPHLLFHTAHYAGQCAALAEAAVNPLVHYLQFGWRSGISPHPLFDNDFYLDRNADVMRAGVPALEHYVRNGAKEGRQPHALFDPAHYAAVNPNAMAAGANLLAHYLEVGWREGRSPCPDFDPKSYLNANPDVAAAGVEPLSHYLTQGAWENRIGAGDFDLEAFLALHGREVLAGQTPLEAYVKAGRPAPPRIADLSGAPAQRATAASTHLYQSLAANAHRDDKDSYDWAAYLGVSQILGADRRRRRDALQPTPPKLIQFKPSELSDRARAFSFATHQAPEATILIPTYGHIKYTLECLASLAQAQRHESVTFEVIVADDASPDDTVAILANVSGLRTVTSPRNQGFLKNVNDAARHARGRVLILLNNDVQVLPGWLRPLVDALNDDNVGAASPKLLFPDGRLQEAGARLRTDGEAHMIGVFDDATEPRFNYARDVDYVSGACIALRTLDFRALGGFDTHFAPAYCEDADLCMRLRAQGKRIRYIPQSVVVHYLSVTSNSESNGYKLRQVRRNKNKLYQRWQDLIAKSNDVRTIAFYLPQFHQVPENDAWWGPGFTEWRNVERALPNFAGHYQPRRPGELGHYDLRQPDTMQRQADLARAYGVSGFCYYYYSFSGRRILEEPLEHMLATGKPDLPFALCWANENWTRRWDGGDNEVLLSQNYTQADDVAIITDVMRYMRAPHYIRINGKPLFVIYRPSLLPDIKRTVETWRRLCRQSGIGEIYLCAMEAFEMARAMKNPREMGLDASIEFPPAGMSEKSNAPREMFNAQYEGLISDYRRIVQLYMGEKVPDFTRFRGVMPSWDNTARRQNDAFIFDQASPGAFQAWLEAVIEETLDQNYGDERIVFINAWNEWAEGAHLEPDLRFGRGWLEAVRNAREAPLLLHSGPKS
jgi:GT2 family glycosyltransferase